MNRKFSLKFIHCGLWMGALLLGAVAAYAQTQVTFQVDMTEQIGSTFNPPGDNVSVHGTFNGWGAGVTLTNNPAAANTNLYTGTVTDTSDANGTVVIYKYVIDTNDYENTWSGNNRCAQLPAGGGSLIVPAAFYDDAGPMITANVTFQVNMAEQINVGAFDTNTGSSVEVYGYFNGWAAGDTLTNDTSILTTNSTGTVTSNVYVGTFAIMAPTNSTDEYKYVVQPGPVYESPLSSDSDVDNNNNRFFINTTATLPDVYFGDKPLTVTVTNNVTFEVDMTALLISGAFNTNETVTLNGDFNNWTGQAMSNTPATPNLYSTAVTIVDAAGATHAYKFVENGTYESLANNRTFTLLDTSGSFTNGPFYFNNQVPVGADFLSTNCMVTFTVNMSNAVGVGSEPIVFDNMYPSSDTVWINGLYNGLNNNFWTWAQAPFPGGASGYQMTQIPNTLLFTITLPVNQGQSADLIYKYSLDGYDNEAGFADNHERWVRSQPNYTMPVDTFGSQGGSTQSEISFGNLAITNIGNNQVQLSWLGRDGVELQTSTNLSATNYWTSQPLTDGTNLMVAPGGEASTNYTVGPGGLFFRLIGPQ
jgi:hypothetical protein